MPRRSPDHAAQTRAALLDAALAVFAERGFAAAQLEGIAKRAQVTRGALYHHFTGKPALFKAVLEERWDTVMAPATDELTPRAPTTTTPGSAGPEKTAEKNPLKATHSFSATTPHINRHGSGVAQNTSHETAHSISVTGGAPGGVERRIHKQVRSFVSTFLHLVEVDPRARALLRMLLSGDHRLPEIADHAPAEDDAPPLVDPLGAWERALAEILSRGGQDPRGAERAHALLAGLLGHAVWVSLRGTGESSVVALAEVLCDGALASGPAPPAFR